MPSQFTSNCLIDKQIQCDLVAGYPITLACIHLNPTGTLLHAALGPESNKQQSVVLTAEEARHKNTGFSVCKTADGRSEWNFNHSPQSSTAQTNSFFRCWRHKVSDKLI